MPKRIEAFWVFLCSVTEGQRDYSFVLPLLTFLPSLVGSSSQVCVLKSRRDYTQKENMLRRYLSHPNVFRRFSRPPGILQARSNYKIRGFVLPDCRWDSHGGETGTSQHSLWPIPFHSGRSQDRGRLAKRVGVQCVPIRSILVPSTRATKDSPRQLRSYTPARPFLGRHPLRLESWCYTNLPWY